MKRFQFLRQIDAHSNWSEIFCRGAWSVFWILRWANSDFFGFFKTWEYEFLEPDLSTKYQFFWEYFFVPHTSWAYLFSKNIWSKIIFCHIVIVDWKHENRQNNSIRTKFQRMEISVHQNSRDRFRIRCRGERKNRSKHCERDTWGSFFFLAVCGCPFHCLCLSTGDVINEHATRSVQKTRGCAFGEESDIETVRGALTEVKNLNNWVISHSHQIANNLQCMRIVFSVCGDFHRVVAVMEPLRCAFAHSAHTRESAKHNYKNI